MEIDCIAEDILYEYHLNGGPVELKNLNTDFKQFVLLVLIILNTIFCDVTIF